MISKLQFYGSYLRKWLGDGLTGENKITSHTFTMEPSKFSCMKLMTALRSGGMPDTFVLTV